MRHSGGFYLDTGVHEFDMARWLLQSDITSVFARGGIYNHPEYAEVKDVDQAHVSFRCGSGAIGLVELSRDAVYGYEIRTEVLGTKGAVQVVQVNATGTALLVDGEVRRDTYRDYSERFREAYFYEMQSFAEVVRNERSPLVGSVDGIRATVVAEAAQRSLVSCRDEDVVNPI
jgi:predicted dehydrogenase